MTWFHQTLEESNLNKARPKFSKGPPADWDELQPLAWDWSRGAMSGKALGRGREEVYKPVLDKLQEAGIIGANVLDPESVRRQTDLYMGLTDSSDLPEDITSIAPDMLLKHKGGKHYKAVMELNELIRDNPELGLEEFDPWAVDAGVMQKARDLEAEFGEAASRSDWTGKAAIFSMGAGSFIADILEDEGALAITGIGTWGSMKAAKPFMQASATKSMARVGLMEALVGGGVELWMQPKIKAWRDKVGLDYSWGDMAMAVGLGTITGGAFGVGLEGLRQGVGAIRFATSRHFASGIIGRELMEQADRLTVGQIDDLIHDLNVQQLSDLSRLLDQAGAKVPAEANHAVNLSSAQEEILNDNPLESVGGPEHIDNVEHLNRTVQADAAIHGEEAVKPLDPNPSIPPRVETDVHHFDNLDGELYRFDLDEIHVDAKTFQFKTVGADEFGVLPTLRGVTEWKPEHAGVIIAWERADGTRFVADGHQRVALAKRIYEKTGEKPKLYGRIWREEDGVTAEDAMLNAALINIGQTVQREGSLIDAARVVRIDPSRIKDLPPALPFVKHIDGLVRLDNEPWGLVINDIVVPEHASVVGRLIEDPQKQMAAMRVLADIKPSSIPQAEAIVRQIRETEFVSTETASLFGPEFLVESLIKERSEILAASVNYFKKNRAAFNLVIRENERLTQAGNVLDHAANLERVATDGEILQILQANANRKGPISDALNAAARAFRDGSLSKQKATAQFGESVRRAMEEGTVDGPTIPGDRSNNKTTPQANLSEEAPSREVLERFDEPDGPGPVEQADSLESDLVEQTEALPPPPPDPEIELPTEGTAYVFDTETSQTIPLDKMKPIRARKSGIANARVYMKASISDPETRRAPLHAEANVDGTYTLLDGNSTYAVLKEFGVKDVPVEIISQEIIERSGSANAAFWGESPVHFSPDSAAGQLWKAAPDAEQKIVVYADELNRAQVNFLENDLGFKQGVNSTEEILARGAPNNELINNTLEEIGKQTGLRIERGPLKKADRIEEKVRDNYGGNYRLVKDAARSTAVIEAPEDANVVVRELGKHFHIVDKGWNVVPEQGYFDRKLIVVMPDGQLSEVQIIPTSMFRAKHELGGHDLYEEWRGLDPVKYAVEREALNHQMQDLYGEALNGLSDEMHGFYGRLVGSMPNMERVFSKSSRVISGDLPSGSIYLTGAQLFEDAFQMNLEPSSFSKAGAMLSTSKYRINSIISDRLLNRNTEPTPAGEQILFEGVDPITQRQRLEAEAQRPLVGGQADADSLPLFDVSARAQMDLLDAIPVEASDGTVQLRTYKDILDDIDRDEKMLARFEDCV